MRFLNGERNMATMRCGEQLWDLGVLIFNQTLVSKPSWMMVDDQWMTGTGRIVQKFESHASSA